MIKLGEIVYLKGGPGLLNPAGNIDKQEIGLVIQELRESGCRNQFKVEFVATGSRLWYWAHQLIKVSESVKDPNV